VRKEDIKGFVPIGVGVQAPRTDKIEGVTKVLIQNGETLVIGGVLQKKQTADSTGVPGFMHIPVLGWLFKNKKTNEETTELLIFITPRVLEKTI
jgi:type IV pilus assembly protein PilQ